MALFNKEETKERTVMVCPDCGNVYYVDGDSSSCSCGCSSYFLTDNLYKESQWKEMSQVSRDEYVKRVTDAVNSARESNKKKIVGQERKMTTTDSFEGYTIEEYLGTVFGTDIYLVGGLVGGGLTNQENLYGSAFQTAKNKMFEKAREIGANAIVGIETQFTGCGTTANMILTVTGTAVKIKKIEA